jgi:hypothetical protein
MKKGSHLSEESKLKISTSLKGRIFSTKHRLNLSISGKEKKKSELHRLRISQSKLGKKLSEKHKRNIGLGGIGRIQSKETKLKISKGNLGKIIPRDVVEKIRLKNLGSKRTKEQRKKLSETLKKQYQNGRKSSWWKGGISDINNVIRNSTDFKMWRKNVFNRDNYICQKCKQIGGKLNPHHIKNFSDFPDERFNLHNGITFCENCHREFHKKYGIKHNTKIQVISFINLLNIEFYDNKCK